MQYHSIIHNSRANGPELRSVIWLQGCRGMNCPGCWNQETHDPEGGRETDPDTLARELFMRCPPGTKGVTISGGEPVQQAISLLQLLRAIRARRPDWSLGLFTGYDFRELTHGNYRLDEYHGFWPARAKQVRAQIWRRIYPMLDFIKLGRFDRACGPGTMPLCTSGNQQLLLPTSRYTYNDFPPLIVEDHIDSEGLHTITGFPL